MAIEFDPAELALIVTEHGFDMARVGEVFDDPTLTVQDDRFDYGELRFITIGWLDRRMIVAVWIPRGNSRGSSVSGKPMTENRSSTAPNFSDDAPDLATTD
ncbi:BrnT family toxin [Paracoccus sp. TK19116]|uniref:BrnT family toxin n=1 Tax=Paracoccus albicereus TaxID=2922394 RepID=A0ABT1MQT2_9RHOB|nr:BrnT family toxin [Paracoccus albicereus]MCQ0970677.1 BrnT family toxin [Paracoccus albicereus]